MEETKTTISERHRAEWRTFREKILSPVTEAEDLDGAKFAKAYADILKVYQEGERKAWGFAEGEAQEMPEYIFDGEGD